jgi:hypothetical protein
MNEMRELIDEQSVERALLALVAVGPLLGLLIGALLAAARRGPMKVLLGRGLALGMLGPLTYLLWRLFSYLVRYAPAPDPRNDYFGLERVDVLLLNCVLFASVGAAVGLAVRKVRARDAKRVGEAPANEVVDVPPAEELGAETPDEAVPPVGNETETQTDPT